MDQSNNPIFPNYSSTPPQAPTPIQQTPTMDTLTPANKPKKVGPIVAILVAVLLILIVVIYFVSKQFEVVSPANDSTAGANVQSAIVMENDKQAQPTPPQEVQAISNTNDDLQSLQSDLDVSIQGLDTQQI